MAGRGGRYPRTDPPYASFPFLQGIYDLKLTEARRIMGIRGGGGVGFRITIRVPSHRRSSLGDENDQEGKVLRGQERGIIWSVLPPPALVFSAPR